jgi:hypothetical protein
MILGRMVIIRIITCFNIDGAYILKNFNTEARASLEIFLGTILSVTPAKLPIVPLATFVLELITPLDLMGLLEIVIFGFREGSLIMVPSGSFICPD